MKNLLVYLFAICLSTSAIAQGELVNSGPMLGYSGFREVLLWLQTTEPAEVKVGYWKDGEKERFTETFSTLKKDDLIAKVFPDQVDYGTTYNYKVYINDKPVISKFKLEFQTQPLWQYRTNPPDFRVALGSCSFIHEVQDDNPQPYGGGYEIFNSITQKNPDLMLWMGDNMYLRTPDFLTENGIRHRYRHTRRNTEMQELLATTHNYATWDDHDYGPNDGNRSYVLKETTEKVFNDYWGNLNTNAAGNGGVAQQFVWNDVEFFMLDNRTHRAPNNSLATNKDYLGKEQIDWLIDALTSSKASFKIVISGGQIISDAAVYENYVTFPEERQRLLDRLEAERIEGVVFMSGDRHHTEISRLERQGAYPLIDITCSPLTAGTHAARDEGNTLQVSGKTFYDHNFGTLDVSGPWGNRELLLTIYDAQGDSVFDYSISQQELNYPE
ncbi:alkaline phosphatase D family protein [Nonlabens antarcticus]|uniref:alkaline phosphatase D family protein n=1 Tax=Nonlabens antarcticus TaxID=392714 RepID=UPI001891630B|nr:alkaline phosphatase D family protein [Nonlabens antarcticus]